MNRLGERSVKNGTGQIFGHNHADQFETMYVDAQGDGTLKTAWQILVENTDPRWAAFQLTSAGSGRRPVYGGAMEAFGDVCAVPRQGHHRHRRADRRQTTVGQGEVDWVASSPPRQGMVQQYVVEQDPPVEPFSFAAESFYTSIAWCTDRARPSCTRSQRPARTGRAVVAVPDLGPRRSTVTLVLKS